MFLFDNFNKMSSSLIMSYGTIDRISVYASDNLTSLNSKVNVWSCTVLQCELGLCVCRL